jgi:hypothetical protein
LLRPDRDLHRRLLQQLAQVSGARGTSWDAVVELARELPEIELSTSYGTPALKVRKKLLVRLKEDGEAIVLRVPDLDAKEALLAMDGDLFFTTPHYDGYAWILVRLAKVKRRALVDLLREAYLAVAPAKLARALAAKG